MANRNRLYFANQQVGLKGDGDGAFGTANVIHGVQTLSIDSSITNEPAFELHQLSIYENVEGLPEITISMDKVLDGYPLMYHMATVDATDPTLAGRSAAKAGFALSTFDQTDGACNIPLSTTWCSGIFINSLSYAFTVDGFFTESVTFLSDNKITTLPAGVATLNAYDTSAGCGCSGLTSQFTTLAAQIQFSGYNCADNDSPQVKVAVREDLLFNYVTGTGLDVNCMVADPDATILPPDIFGITASGTNENDTVAVQNITISTDFNRETFNALGKRGVVFRAISFPIEVTTDIEIIASQNDMVSLLEAGTCENIGGCGIRGSNLRNRTIRVATCEGTRVYTGVKNKLASVSYGGGDAGGGNVSITYSYTTFNDLTVLHENDPNASGATWWADKPTYLVDLV